MNQPAENNKFGGETVSSNSKSLLGESLGRMSRLTLKELRETLRDRRTIMTLVVMPLLVYPLLSVVFQKFLVTSFRPPGEAIYQIAVESEQARQRVVRHLNAGELYLSQRRLRESASDPQFTDPSDSVPENAQKSTKRKLSGKKTKLQKEFVNFESQVEVVVVDDLEQAVAEGIYDLGIRVRKSIALPTALGFRERTEFELIHRAKSPLSQETLQYVERVLRVLNSEVRIRQLERCGVPRHAVPVKLVRLEIDNLGTTSSFSLAALVPLILILMTITGAVYPAIDLTAGERERGTLEMLVAAPVPRLGLLMAKYFAVLIVAVLTATVNLLGMSLTILATGLGPFLFGPDGLSFFTVLAVFGLMLLFASFFSALLLVLTSFARSFKEAQAYLIPLMLVSIAPGLLSMMPDLSLSGMLMMTPLANIVLLARDLFSGNVNPLEVVAVVLSTLFYAMAALAIAARIFGTDAILYGSHGTWSDFFRRPRKPSATASISGAMMCLALLFPGSVLLGQFVARAAALPIGVRLILTGMVTIVLFAGVPTFAAHLRRVQWRTGFSLNRPRGVSYLAAVLLGVSLWPFVFEVSVFSMEWGVTFINPEVQALSKNLIDKMRTVSPLIVLFSLAIIPAVCEEFFFRGFLLSSLRSRLSNRKSILASAFLFGLFHVVVRDALAVERMLPSTILGMVLAYVCIQTGSLYPGMVMHACHNGFLLLVAYYEQELIARNIGIQQASHLPGSWLIAAFLVAGIGFILLRFSRRPEESFSEKND